VGRKNGWRRPSVERIEAQSHDTGELCPMQTTAYRKGYFMSEESEKAAKWDTLIQLKKEKSRLSSLYKQAEETGKELEDFGSVLKNRSWVFTVTENAIYGKGTVQDTGDRSIQFESLDGKKISSLINDINETQETIRRLQEHIKDEEI